jgi:UDP-N-acetylglucosamine--N-acetylmuramyl-(pentapeptide) pyrophosphoryl-undecaprenol N-acetylglucosamine transferase
VKKVIFAAAGTAGHIEPALAVARELQVLIPDVEMVFVGTQGGIENSLVVAAGHTLKNITKAAFPRSLNRDLFSWKFRFLRSLVEAIRIVKGSDLVIGFGGYVCGSTYFAAKLVGVPIIAHEANAKPGMSTRLARLCGASLLTAFADGKAEVVGLPLRRSIIELSEKSKAEREELRTNSILAYGLDPDKPTILIFGGSLGSKKFNGVVSQTLEGLLSSGVQIVHAVGKNNACPASQPGYVPLAYIDDMPKAYAAADIAISRAGAATVIETGLLGVYTIYVPLPIGNGEQSFNAAAIVAEGGGVVVMDADFDGSWLESHLPEQLEAATLRRTQELTIAFPKDAALVIAKRAELEISARKGE